MQAPTAAHVRDLSDYVSLVRRRWGWIAICAVLGVLLGSVFLVLADRTYASQARVLVQETGTESVSVGERTNSGINLDTEAQLVTSEPVATRAAKILGTDLSPVSLATRVTVTVPANTTVMVLSFRAPTAEEAQRGAAAFAEAYLAKREDDANSTLQREISRLEDLVANVSDDVRTTNVQLARLPRGIDSASQRSFLKARRAALTSRLSSYNTALAPLVGAVVRAGEVIGEAQEPLTPIDPNPLLVLPSGLMGGLLLGLGFAAVRERLDQRIHSGADLERVFGLVPAAELHAGRQRRGARLEHDVRALYHTLRAYSSTGGRERVMLVGPEATESAQHLSWSLALVAARSGAPTCYVVAPEASAETAPAPEVVEGSPMLRVEDYASLEVLVDGELRSGVLAAELDELGKISEFLVLDLPTQDPIVDIPALGRHLDLAVVVVRLGVTRRDSLSSVLVTLSKSGVTAVQAVTLDLGRKGWSRSRVDAAKTLRAPVAPVVVTESEDRGHQTPAANDQARPPARSSEDDADDAAAAGATAGALGGPGASGGPQPSTAMVPVPVKKPRGPR